MKLHELKGCGPAREKVLNEMGIISLETLVLNVPKKYETRIIKDPDKEEARFFNATVVSRPKIAYIRKNLKKLTCKVNVLNQDYTLSLFNQTHWVRHLSEGTQIVVYGTLDTHIKAQKIYLKKSFNEGILPFYKLKGIPDDTLRKWLKESLSKLNFTEDLSEEIIQKYQLQDKKTMLETLHFPIDASHLEKATHTQKIRYLIKRLKSRIPKNNKDNKPRYEWNLERLNNRIKKLPFTLTPDQINALNEGFEDLRSLNPTRRLYQGDTGSGKTVVALLLALLVLDQGLQVAFMAPTEILAHQHYQTFLTLFPNEPFDAAYLSGSMDLKTTKEIHEKIKNNTAKLIFGTHALFSKSLRFNELGLVIIDEEQRFGVNQREALLKKGHAADFISLSATPIPRTLALTLYQDMQVTSIKGMPASRKQVKTEIIPLKDATFLDPVIQMALDDDKQIFVIAPRIEDDESLLSIERIEKYYKKTFKKATIQTLHGKLPSEDKTTILTAFKNKKVDILISTTVVEVGIDIENATLMLIYHAERYGVSQIHQLRGRLGRHQFEGVCYLIYRGDQTVKERLTLLKNVNDGFELSYLDLKTRGFGSLFGESQSGFLEMAHWPYEETLTLLNALKEDLKNE